MNTLASDYRFLLNDVEIKTVDRVSPCDHPLYTDAFTALNERYFFLHVPDVADFSVAKGRLIAISNDHLEKKNEIELFLNGSVLGATLHQRGHLPIHGSAISHKGKGILICGESGMGKSTLTYGIAQDPSFEFLTDDITPISKIEDLYMIQAIGDKMKLWKESLDHFGCPLIPSQEVRPGFNKYFVEMEPAAHYNYPLSMLIVLARSVDDRIHTRVLEGAEKFEALSNNIYRREYLEGMKTTKLAYFKLLTEITQHVQIVNVSIPEKHPIDKTVESVRRQVSSHTN